MVVSGWWSVVTTQLLAKTAQQCNTDHWPLATDHC